MNEKPVTSICSKPTVCVPDEWLQEGLSSSEVVPERTIGQLDPRGFASMESFDLRIPIGRLDGRAGLRAARLVHSLPRGASIVWLDLGERPVPDWAAFRAVWEQFVESVLQRRHRLRGLGLSSAALLLPGSSMGHLSPEFAFGLTPEAVGERWAGIPISPLRAADYLAAEHWVNGEAHRPVPALRRLGVQIQGEIDERGMAALEGVSSADLPGKTAADRMLSFLRLLPSLDRIRVADRNMLPLDRLRALDRVRGVANFPAVKTASSQERSHRPRPGRSLGPGFWRSLELGGTFQGIQQMELLMVVRGHKPAMRTMCAPKVWQGVQDALDELGVCWVTCVRHLRSLRRDRGKGGFSSSFEVDAGGGVGGDGGHQERFVYVGVDRATAERAMELDTLDDERFGEILGYPACCRTAFRRNFPHACSEQGDVVPVVVDQTISRGPWPFTLNMGAWYFGIGIVGFFPCTLDCIAAKQYGETAYREIERILPHEAHRLRRFLCSPVIYSEYRGVHFLAGASISGRVLRYDPERVMSTSRGGIARLLLAGDRVGAAPRGRIQVMRGRQPVGSFGAGARILTFHGETR